MGKFKGKRWLAGAMAVMLCCSSFLQTGVFTVSAEAEAEVAQEAMQEPAVVEKTEEELLQKPLRIRLLPSQLNREPTLK